MGRYICRYAFIGGQCYSRDSVPSLSQLRKPTMVVVAVQGAPPSSRFGRGPNVVNPVRTEPDPEPEGTVPAAATVLQAAQPPLHSCSVAPSCCLALSCSCAILPSGTLVLSFHLAPSGTSHHAWVAALHCPWVASSHSCSCTVCGLCPRTVRRSHPARSVTRHMYNTVSLQA